MISLGPAVKSTRGRRSRPDPETTTGRETRRESFARVVVVAKSLQKVASCNRQTPVDVVAMAAASRLSLPHRPSRRDDVDDDDGWRVAEEASGASSGTHHAVTRSVSWSTSWFS